MSQSPFNTFLALIEFDQQIVQLQEKLKSAQKEMYALQDQEAALMKDVDRAHNAAIAAQKEVDARELEMKELDVLEKDKKVRLENVANQKEYKSVKIEIERIGKKQHALEQDLVVVWNRLETAKKTEEEKKLSVVDKIATIKEAISAKDSLVNELSAAIDEQTSVRPGKEKVVPQEWLDKYAQMRAQVIDPVVPVINGSCNACFYKVTSHDMQSLRKNKLVQCKECYRLLYLPGAADQDSVTE